MRPRICWGAGSRAAVSGRLEVDRGMPAGIRVEQIGDHIPCEKSRPEVSLGAACQNFGRVEICGSLLSVIDPSAHRCALKSWIGR
jgi:hypothetical protein